MHHLISLYNKLLSLIGFKNNDELGWHLVRSAFGSLIISVSSNFLALILTILISRYLGAKGLGIYAFCRSVPVLLAMPTVLGLPHFILREVSSYAAQRDYPLLRGLLIRSSQIVGCVALFMASAGAGIMFIGANVIPEMYFTPLLIALSLIPLHAMLQILSFALRGLDKIITSQLPQLIGRTVLVFLVSVLFILYPQQVSPVWLISCAVGSIVLQVILLSILLLKNLPKEVRYARAQYKPSSWLRSSRSFLLSGNVAFFYNEIPTAILGCLGIPSELGYFRVAQRGAQLITFGITAVNSAMGPTLSRLYTTGDLKSLQEVLTKSAKRMILYCLPVALLLMVGGIWLLPFVFGAAFKASFIPLVILCSGQLVYASVGSAGYVLNMTRNQGLAARGAVVFLLALAPTNLLLGSLFGAVGASLATSLSYTLWVGLTAVWLYKKLHVTTNPFGLLKLTSTPSKA